MSSDQVQATLDAFQLVYLADFRVVVCRLCHCAVQPAFLRAHLVKHHRSADSPVSALRAAVDLLTAHLELVQPLDLVSPPHHGPPVPELALSPGFICAVCGDYCCLKESSMVKHAQSVHRFSVKRGRAVPWSACTAQTFFRGPGKRYFAVRAEQGRSLNEAMEDALRLHRELQARDAQAAAVIPVAPERADRTPW
jgi:hypothetical protein